MKKVIAVVAALVLSAVWIVNADDAKKPDEVTLKGKIGCASCSYGVSKECGVSLKTDDGKIYTLTKASKELMEARHKDGILQVTGKVTEKDGKLFVDASKAELVK
ncbi:MAG: hypothetical protein ABSD58_07945 [Verrucomicrobiia bacterium]